MEIYLHIGISAIGLSILFFLLPIRWTFLGKVVIWFTSSLIGTLFTLTWNIQPTVKTILLHLLLAMAMSYLIIKRGVALFELPKDEKFKSNSTQVKPLFNYQTQLEKAKTAKPANIVQTEMISDNVRGGETEIVSQEMFRTERPDVSVLSKMEALSQEQQSFILDGFDFEEKHEEKIDSQKVPEVEKAQMVDMIEDEPGYLLEDWIMEDATLEGMEEEHSKNVQEQVSVLTHAENIISIDQKRKEKLQTNSFNNIQEIDWIHPEVNVKKQSQDGEIVQLEEELEQTTLGIEDSPSSDGVVGEKEVKPISELLEEEEPSKSMEQHTKEDDIEKYESVLDGRALLLNDGLANLYKERAESIKKLKSKDEHADSTLKEQKQFLQELSNWFRASND